MRILITGATSGIGEELAMQYAFDGNEVIACGRNQQKLDRLVQQHSSITPLCFDLTDIDNYPPLPSDVDSLDMVIFNAGDCEYIDDPLAFDAKKFERVININLISIGYGLEAWLQHLKPKGRAVFVSSSASLLALPRAEAYGTSKAALTYLAQTLAITLKQHNISVSLVLPGFVETPLTDRNTFAMPMIISKQQAVKKIIAGLEKGKSEISFPFMFVFVMKLFRLLPWPLWTKLATRIK
jgi:short-subunit dehydrogenase